MSLESEIFLKENVNNMFECSSYNKPCKLSYSECLRRQKAVKSSKHPTPGYVQRSSGGSTYDYTPCLKCQAGKLNKAKAKSKMVKVPVPGKFQDDFTKHCKCGEVFIRPKCMRQNVWDKMIYCDKHRAMNSLARKADILRLTNK